ncbi:tetratricopeptide repeat protein gnn, partial [Plakobranchus ocellatus]
MSDIVHVQLNLTLIFQILQFLKKILQARDRLIQRFSSESEEARSKVHDLRQRMINRGVPVRFFRTLEELGQIVLEDWVEVINTVLPPLLHSVKLL